MQNSVIGRICFVAWRQGQSGLRGLVRLSYSYRVVSHYKLLSLPDDFDSALRCACIIASVSVIDLICILERGIYEKGVLSNTASWRLCGLILRFC